MCTASVFKRDLHEAHKRNDPFELTKVIDKAEQKATRVEEHICFEDGSVLAVIFEPSRRGIGLTPVGCAIVKNEENA